MWSKLVFSGFSQKIYAFLLTFVLLLSTIIMFSPQSEAENDDIWMEVYFHHDNGHLWADVWFEGDYSENYTVVWNILDEGGTVMDYDYEEFNDTSDYWMQIELDISSYPSGDYNFTVDLYEENTLVEDFKENFEVHPWLKIEFPYHLPEAGDVNLSVSVASADPNTNYSIEWHLMDYDTEEDLMDNSTNITDYNWILNLSEGHYHLEVILYEEVSNNSGNDTWWAEIDWEYMRLYIGGALLWLETYSGDDDHLGVNMGVEYADYDTNFTAVWNITDYNGNLIDNGLTSFPNNEPWHWFHISTVNYSAGDYWLNVDLYSGAANPTDIYESSAHQSFWIHTAVQVWPEEYQYENEGNITILFDAYHVNTSRDYRIEWNLFDENDYFEVDSGEIYMNSTTNFSGNFTTPFLTASDYGIEAYLYEWAPVNNGTDWNWTFVDHSYRYFHVGGAELDVWHGFEGNGLYFNGCVQYTDWTVNYTGDWEITDENNMIVAQGAIPFDEWGENCFYFDLPANDFELRETYTAVFDLYENGTYLNNYTFDLEVYLLFDFFIDYYWDEGSYVNGTYYTNTGNEDYTLYWSLENDDYPNNFYASDSFDSNSDNGMLEFFNLPEGYYHLDIEISIEYQFNCSNCTNENFHFYFNFEVDDDPVSPNTAPYCDLNGNMLPGSSIDALVGDTLTFGMTCIDDDGDDMTMSAAIDHSSFGTPFMLDVITGDTSSWTYTFADAGLYSIGMSVNDDNGDGEFGQSSYAFAVSVLDNNATTNETEELLEDIEPDEVPSISILVSAVTIALIAFRRRIN